MEYVSPARFVFAFMAVLGLIGLLALLARRFGAQSMLIKDKSKARLQVMESLPLDARARLLIIRRDGVEHLLVRTAESVQVVETGFTAPAVIPQDSPETPTQGSEDDA